MDIPKVIQGARDIYDIASYASKSYKDYKIKLLLETLSVELSNNLDFRPETYKKLFNQSHDNHFQQTLDQAVTKTFLANSNLAIRMIAIYISSRTSKALSYSELNVLRILQDITDFEIIFFRKMWNESTDFGQDKRYLHQYPDDAESKRNEQYREIAHSLRAVGLIRVDLENLINTTSVYIDKKNFYFFDLIERAMNIKKD